MVFHRKLCLVCGSSDSDPEVTKMHYFPSNMEKSKLWQQSMGITFSGESLRNSTICSRHFTPEMYCNGTKLSRNAVPTLYPCTPKTTHNGVIYIEQFAEGVRKGGKCYRAASKKPYVLGEISNRPRLTKNIENTSTSTECQRDKASVSIPPSIDAKPIDLASNVATDGKWSPYIKGYEVIKHLSDFKTAELEDFSYLNLEILASAVPPQEQINLPYDPPVEDFSINIESTDVNEEVGIDLTDTRIAEIPSPPESGRISEVVKEPLFKSLKGHSKEDNKILDKCRICFASLQENEIVHLDSCIGEESVQMTDMLKFVLSNIDLDIYSDVVVCVKCTELLSYSYQLKKTWLATEETLQNILKEKKSLKRDDDVIIYEDPIENQKDKVETVEPVEHIDHDYTSLQEDVKSKLFVRVKRKRVKLPKFCEKCGKFVTQLAGHLRMHKKKEAQIHADKRKMCEVCGLLIKPMGLLKHLKKHTVEPNCSICNKTWPNLEALKKHTRNVHQKENYQCHICGKQVFGLVAFRSHFRRHSPKTWPCNICGKVLSSAPSLCKHRLMHNPQNCSCHICGKTLKYKSSLERHIQIFHMNMAKNFCDVCEKPYWKKYDLVKHKIRVHGIFPDKASDD